MAERLVIEMNHGENRNNYMFHPIRSLCSVFRSATVRLNGRGSHRPGFSIDSSDACQHHVWMEKIVNWKAALVRSIGPILMLATSLAGAPFDTGDVLISARFGPDVHVYDSDGTLVQTVPASTLQWGLVFGPGGNLYVAGGTDVLKFDTAGNFLGTFGSGFAGPVTDLDFDSSGNAYMGGIVDASQSWLAKFTPAGVLVDQVIFNAEEGPVHLDLSVDDRTLYFVSPRGPIGVFDVSTWMFVPWISDSSSAGSGDLKELPDGGLLFAGDNGIGRLDPGGTLIRTYDFLGSEPWRGLDLAPDRISFWAVDDFGRTRRFDLATGGILDSFTASLGAPYSGLAVAPVPEPASWLLVAVGLAMTGFAAARSDR